MTSYRYAMANPLDWTTLGAEINTTTGTTGTYTLKYAPVSVVAHQSLAEYFTGVTLSTMCPMCGGIVVSKDHAALTVNCVVKGGRRVEHGAWEICKYLMNITPKTPKEPEPTDWGEYGL